MVKINKMVKYLQFGKSLLHPEFFFQAHLLLQLFVNKISINKKTMESHCKHVSAGCPKMSL